MKWQLIKVEIFCFTSTLADHRVFDRMIVPAAAFLEMASAACAELHGAVPWRTRRRPSGLERSEASLERYLLGAIPIDRVRPVRSRTSPLIRLPASRGGP